MSTANCAGLFTTTSAQCTAFIAPYPLFETLEKIMTSKKPAIAIVTTLLLSACAGGPAVFQHPVHGEVTTKDPAFQAQSKTCGDIAYKNGVTIDGKTYTDVNSAREAYAHYLVYKLPREAGYQPGMKPSFQKEWRAAEDAYWQCMNEAGFKRKV
jgi:hypothetical protein